MMQQKIKIGIVGGAGYTGGELIRILIHHPYAEIKFVHSRSQSGKAIHTVHTDLLGDCDIIFTDKLSDEIDVLFLCLGHGESKVFLAEAAIAPDIKIIDLSQDFRNTPDYKHGNFVYGLPEANREQIKNSSYIANPGCFATAIQLGILPLVKDGKALENIHITGITGSTGAGQKLQSTAHHSWRNNNVNAYKTLNHQHIQEIKTNLGIKHDLPFVPWRGDFTRGIYISTVVKSNESLETIQGIYNDYYSLHPFTHVAPFAIDVKQVVNTNKAFIQLEKVEDQLIIHSAIDNLIKGASGQAVQNMNLIFDFPETSGLQLKPTAF